MSNGFNNDYEQRLLGDGSQENIGTAGLDETEKEESEEYYELPLAIRSRSLIWSVISFTASILSIALCPLYYVGLVFAVGAVVLSLISRRNLGFFEKYSIMGLILGITGFVFGVFSAVASSIGLFG